MSLSNDAKPENYAVNARICQLVAQCPFMYDRSHTQYLKKDVCDEAWLRIAKEMGESVSTCRERWRNIRTSFARSINTNKIACRANRTKPYYLHEELKFLLDYITPGVPVMRRYKKKTTSNGGSGGEESELIEVSVGEDTFNGFEHLSCTFGENGDSTQPEPPENKWHQEQEQQLQEHNSEMGAENGGHNESQESCDSSLAEERLNSNAAEPQPQEHAHEDEDARATSRLARLPPPPLQAAPLSAFQRGAAETEAAVALQQIQMSTMPPKRARLETQLSNTASDASAIHFLAEQQRRVSRCDNLNGNCNGVSSGIAYGDELKFIAEQNVDAGFLQELNLEMRGMDRRQKIHFKRRVYEALAEIYPINNSLTTAAALMQDLSTPAMPAALPEMPRPILLAKPVASHVSTQVTRQDLPAWPAAKRLRSEGTHDAVVAVVASPAEIPAATTTKRHSTKGATRSTLHESSVAITRSATAERRIRPGNQSQAQQPGTQSVKDEPDGGHFSD